MDDWITAVYLHNGTLFSNKRNKLLIHTIWINLKELCQIKEAQFQNVHYCMIPITQYSWKDKTMWQRTDQWFSRS